MRIKFSISLLILSLNLNAVFIDKSQKEKIPSFEDISEFKAYYLNRLNIMELNGFNKKIIQSERKKILALSKTEKRIDSNIVISRNFLSKSERMKLEELQNLIELRIRSSN
ncbi:MAG: hypothetical protein ACJ0GU_04700 [Gammaproteobacteria bacterium]